MELKQIGVIGADQMGSGIVQACAQAAFSVVMVDTYREQTDRGLAMITRSLGRRVEQGRLSASERDEIIPRIRTSLEISDLQSCDLIVEATTEDLGSKKQVFAQLDKIVRREIVLATCTTMLSVTELAASTQFPPRVVGTHFFTPVPTARVVEVVKGLETADEAVQLVTDLVIKTGKKAVTVNDSPGLVFNRVVLAMINEASYTLLEGVATVDAIDAALKLGADFGAGPLEMADRIGLDTCLQNLELLHRELGNTQFRPCPLLRKMVAGGFLGRKSGRGFYRY